MEQGMEVTFLLQPSRRWGKQVTDWNSKVSRALPGKFKRKNRVIPINAAAVRVSPRLQRPVWIPPFPHATRLHSLPISFPVPSPAGPCSSSVPSSTARAHPPSPELANLSKPHMSYTSAGSGSSTSPHSRFRVPSPSVSPSPHPPSPQLPHRGPASPGAPYPVPHTRCPVSRVPGPPHAAPLPQARPHRGGASRFAPPIR